MALCEASLTDNSLSDKRFRLLGSFGKNRPWREVCSVNWAMRRRNGLRGGPGRVLLRSAHEKTRHAARPSIESTLNYGVSHTINLNYGVSHTINVSKSQAKSPTAKSPIG